MLYLAANHTAFYEAILQEDRFVEWLTALFFLAAGVLRSVDAVRHRRAFDLLVGLYCIFVGGEEFSWGQRLLGFTPPDVFLEHNTQQEFTLHNFADLFGKPKGVLILSLIGYGMLLPVLHHFGRTRAWLERAGGTAPRISIAVWLLVAALILVWYPAELTGEWVEALAGFLFLFSAPVTFGARATAMFTGISVAALLTLISVRMAAGSPALVRCAQLETDALIADIGMSLGTSTDLIERNVHKRFYSAVQEGYIASEFLNYVGTRCAGETELAAQRRRRFMLDPWGMAYWVRSRSIGDRVRITVYSFGANRNRGAGDIQATIEF
jgi:hypothetical protein